MHLTRFLAAVVLSALAVPVRTFSAEAAPAIVNLSSRANVGAGNQVLIAGFVVEGQSPKKVLLRAVGPGLKSKGVANALAAMRLQVFDAAGRVLTSNEQWSPSLATAFKQVGAFDLSAGSHDAALLLTLPPAAYTAQVSGIDNAQGVALVEIYEIDATSHLVNVSTRTKVETGDGILISGLVIGAGNGTRRVLVRAAGPSLVPMGVSDALLDPVFSVRNAGGAEIAANNDWGRNPDPAAITAASSTVGAFAFSPNSKDAAAIADLAPGAYTVQVSGNGGTTGIALVEVYDLGGVPTSTAPALPEISLVATSDTSATSTLPGVFALTRTGETSSALTVRYTIGGTALNGSAYARLTGAAVLPAGSTQAAINIVPTGNGSGSVTLTLAPDAAYRLAAQSVASVLIASTPVSVPTPTPSTPAPEPDAESTPGVVLPDLPDSSPPVENEEKAPDIEPVQPAVVSLAVLTDVTRADSGLPGVFALTRAGDKSGQLTVTYTLSGTAVAGRDFEPLSGTAVFLPGVAQTTFNVIPLSTGRGTVAVRLAASSDYTLAPQVAATVTILPALPEVNVSATVSQAQAGDSTPAVFTLTRSGSAADSLTVSLAVSGTAAADAYAPVATTAAFQAGASTATVSIVPTASGDGTVVLTLQSGSAYKIGAQSSATVTIAPLPSVVAPVALAWDRASIDARFGPAFTDLHPDAVDDRPTTYKPATKTFTTAEAKKYSYRVAAYELGAAPGDDFADYWSCSGQVAYSPDDPISDPGLDRIQTFAYYNKVWALSPRLDPGSSKPHPDPQTRESNQIAANGGTMPMQPIAMVRNAAIWQSEALVLYRDGLLGVAGTQTSRAANERPYPGFKFPANKVPTALAITTANEFALITVWDTDRRQGQLAVVALEGKFLAYHTWPYMGMMNQGSWSDFKLLGYIDLPLTSPDAVAAASNGYWAGPSVIAGKVLSQVDLADDRQRQLVASGDWQSIAAKKGYAIVSSHAENKAVIVDLTPLFNYMRESYLGTAAAFQNAIATRGPAPAQFPQTFDVRPSAMPKVVWSATVDEPTCVLAGQKIGRWTKDHYKAYIATRDGTIHIIDTSSLMNRSDWETGGALREVGTFQVGRNPVAMAFARFNQSGLPLLPAKDALGNPSTSDPLNNLFHVACRGERSVDTVVTFKGQGAVHRRIRDSRLDDPVGLGVADRGNILTVADFRGKKIVSFRINAINDSRNGIVYGCGPTGTDPYEFAGELPLSGSPFLVNSANVN